MTLLYPHFLWLLIPLGILLWHSPKRLISVVHLLILMLLVLTMTRPVYEKALQETNIEAKEIIIALDVSYSMRATDLKPTRYDYAKKTINALLLQNPADNIMLMAFTSNPLLLSPPTTDHRLIALALESLNPKHILTKGTSLKKLFTKLSTMHTGHKNLILMTDGGEESNLDSLGRLIQKSNLSLTILALGTAQGTTVETEEGTLLKNKEGELVVSRINPELESLAASVQGSYLLPSGSAENTAEKLNQALKKAEKKDTMIQKMQRHYVERYQLPLGLALLLFFMLHTRAVKYLILLFTLLGYPLQASLMDDYHLHHAYQSYQKNDFDHTLKELKQIKVPSLQSQIALANTYYRQHAYKKSIQTYQSIRSSSSLVKQHLYYNIANAYAQLEAYDKAKKYYTKALQLGAEEDAKQNLALVIFLSDKKEASLGMAHPKSQNTSASKSESQEAGEEEETEDQSSSGSGGGGGEKSAQEKHKQEKQKKGQLLMDKNAEQQPLGSKVYELINKGYIRETQPW